MKANRRTSLTELDPDARWLLREQYWRRKLSRLRFGVEPIEEQVARYRRATWALCVVLLLLALMFFSLFAVFRRPGIGLVVVCLLPLPVILGAWLDHALLARRARQYLQERAEYLGRRGPATSDAPRDAPRG